MGDFPPALAFTLAEEGGWADRPDDPGGPTNHGITLATYQTWALSRGQPEPSVDDLRVIDQTTVAAILHGGYWEAISGDGLPEGVDLSLFDFAVNAGPARAARQLQACIGARIDGIVGPETLGLARNISPFVLVSELADAQEAYYRALPDFPEFGRGWLARTQRRRTAAMGLLSGRGGGR